jgi:hypothetical protein
MDINDGFDQDDVNQGTSAKFMTIAGVILKQVLIGLMMLLILASTIAFFSSPVWFPALVDALWIR